MDFVTVLELAEAVGAAKYKRDRCLDVFQPAFCKAEEAALQQAKDRVEAGFDLMVRDVVYWILEDHKSEYHYK